MDSLGLSGDELDNLLQAGGSDSEELELESDESLRPKSNPFKEVEKEDDFDDGFDDDEEDNKDNETFDDDFDEASDDDFDEDEAPEEVSKEQKSKKAMYIVWGICAVIFIVFFAITKVSDNKSTETVEDSKGGVVENSNSTIFHAEKLEVGQTMYKDYLVISKYISMEGSNLVPKFTGNLESYGQTVELAVDLDTYNSYPSGSRVSVVFYKTLVDNEEKVVIIQVQPVK